MDISAFLEQFSNKIMLVRIQQELPKISYAMFRLFWPARSPDLSSIKHVRDQRKRQMPLCHSARDLEVAVQNLWTRLPQDNIRRVSNSMSDRVTAYIAAGGGPTRH